MSKEEEIKREINDHHNEICKKLEELYEVNPEEWGYVLSVLVSEFMQYIEEEHRREFFEHVLKMSKGID